MAKLQDARALDTRGEIRGDGNSSIATTLRQEAHGCEPRSPRKDTAPILISSNGNPSCYAEARWVLGVYGKVVEPPTCHVGAVMLVDASSTYPAIFAMLQSKPDALRQRLM